MQCGWQRLGVGWAVAIEVGLEFVGVERGGHDHDQKVGAMGLLDIKSASQRDIAIEMPLVEFVEDDGGDAFEGGVGDQLAKEDTFGFKLELGCGAGDVFEADLEPDLLTESTPEFGGDARGEQTCGEAAGLEDDALAVVEKPVFEQDLGHLSGLTGAGGGLQNEPTGRFERFDDGDFDVVDGELSR